MKIIKKDIQKLMIRTGYISRQDESDAQANFFLNCWCFFAEKESEIRELTGELLETIIYTKYYWCTQYKKRFNTLYGNDAGIDQQQYKIIEEIMRRISNVDWTLIHKIDEGDI